MEAWWWFPISAALAVCGAGVARAAGRWFIDALEKTFTDAVKRIVAEFTKQWIDRFADHERRITALETRKET